MVPWSLQPLSVAAGEVIPHYLREPDHGWLRALLHAYRRFEGRPRRELEAHLQAPLVAPVSPARLRLARHVLDRLWPEGPGSALPAVQARAAVFAAAAAEPGLGRERVLAQVARRLRVPRARLEEALFSDLPGERRLGPMPPGLEPGELALRVNLALAQGLLGRAREVALTLEGNARAVVRQARWAGLLCVVRPGPRGGGACLEISGPLALFRRTRLYGRALAGLVPTLHRCPRFALTASCEVEGEEHLFRLQTGDPIFPAAAPEPFDSRVERRFHEEFLRAAPDWDLLREPEPVPAGDQLLFPDFAVVHRRQPWRRWLLEIMGFWTQAYLERKLEAVRRAAIPRLLLAVDLDRQADLSSLPGSVAVLPFRGRLSPESVLAVLELSKM